MKLLATKIVFGAIAALWLAGSHQAAAYEHGHGGYGGHRGGQGYYRGGYGHGYRGNGGVYYGGYGYGGWPYYYPAYYPYYYADANPYYAYAAPPAYQNAAAPYCREYTGSVMVGGQPQPIYGTACQQPDGSWRVVN